MTHMPSKLVLAAAASLLVAPSAALAKGGVSGGGGTGGGGKGGGATAPAPAPAPSIGSIRAVSTTATCTDGYAFSVTFRKGFNKRVEEVLTFVNQPEGYWSFRLHNDTDNKPMGGFSGGYGAAPSRQITNLTTNVPVGATQLTLSVERSSFVSAAMFAPVGPVEQTCSATVTVVG